MTNHLERTDPSLEVISRKFEAFGITYFSYGLASQGNILKGVFSNEEWGQHYKENRYDKTDPLVHGVVQSHFPLIIWDAMHLFGKERKVMMERSEICGIKSGLTIGMKNHQGTEIIALGAKVPPQEFYKLLNDNTHIREIHRIVREFYTSQKNKL